ncbi:choice-of-anchor A family protein [Hyalangium sp.]|uniref:choice-of-anchor A family protein n=1 Tax=Hyalangium sp. TaxID=2028555 RepID=UPI002D72EF13|nr:choice-of-anchor A family protein [Hyalangium sp.]HYH96403.1 choice-of-anchor A family protein [Hyalangium sp.]
MQTRSMFFLSWVVAVATACTEADLPRLERQVQSGVIGTRAERQLMASRQQVKPSGAGSLTSARDMAQALGLPAERVTGAQLTSPDPEAALILPEFGLIQPREGNSLVVLSTGLINLDHLPEPGSDLLSAGVHDDAVTLQVTVNVPPGLNRLSFDYNFLSAESPDYVGSEYNDEFTVQVTDARGAREAARASVNSSFFFDVSATRGGGTGFDLLMADDPAGPDWFQNGPPAGVPLFPDAGITDFQTINVEVESGGPVTLKFDIRDRGDGILDSTVVLDNITFSSMEVLDPNPSLMDAFRGTVKTDPTALALEGRNVQEVAADGVTQVLLRVNVPGPGEMRFSLLGAHAPADGGLSAVGRADRSDSITVNVQQAAPGQYYAFALYMSPEDFDTGGDAEARSRNVRIETQYTPTSGAGFGDTYNVTIVRPPVVIVHDIWSSCAFWDGDTSIYRHNIFTPTCADYSATNSSSLERNSAVVPDAVFEALEELRRGGTAVTQVDVIAHGMGGLLTRKYADWPNYRRFTNFNGGDLNRLIAMNTPHVGTRMADRIVELREELQECDLDTWADVKAELLDPHGISIEVAGGSAIDDLKTNSEVINSIGRTQVPSHLLVSRGGRALEDTISRQMLLDSIRTLYSKLEFLHPAARTLPPSQRRKLILGPQSKVFCSKTHGDGVVMTDDHDLFVTEADQKGGVAEPDAISYFDVDPLLENSEHFRVPHNPAHKDKLVELLNSPINGGKFTPSIPSPGTVERVNHCAEIPSAPTCRGLAKQSAAGLTSAPLPPLARLRVVSPGAGTPVSPGSTVPVVVEASGGFQPAVVSITGAERSVFLEAPPFTAEFPIPAQAIGKVELRAFGIDEEGRMRVSELVLLPVASSAKLTSIEILNGDATLRGPGSTRRLQVLGHYDDGVTRNISSPGLGTVYSSSNSNVARVTSDGSLTATGSGLATVVVRNGAVFTSITVTVGDNSFGRCIEVRLGDYNLFVLEDYTQGHDVQGQVAAGGNIALQDFSIGAVLPDTDTDRVLVAGGDVTLSRGGVWGDTWYGRQLVSDPSVTFWRGTASHGTPLDFAARGSALRTLSSELAALPTNGTTTVESWGGLLLRGTAARVNVFDVDANALTGTRHLSIEAPANSFVIINVRGTSATLSNLGQAFGGGIDERGVLFNFPDATVLTASGYGLYGTVLAPQAHVHFNNGSWDGGIYARSLTGNAEGHLRPLRDMDICL